jgi:hypothetical protein
MFKVMHSPVVAVFDDFLPYTAREDGTAHRLWTRYTLADDRRSAGAIGVICHPFAVWPSIALDTKAQFFEEAY